MTTKKKKKNIKYTALTDVEGIRTRKHVYIGEGNTPDQLLTEALDNAIDEISNKLAKTCKVYFDLDNFIIQVEDDGRGLNVYDMENSNGELIDSVILLCTELHTGAKFDTTNYKTLFGQNGMGLVIVNALSNYVMIKTRLKNDKTKVYQYIFKNSIFISKEILEDNDNYSTLINFQPNSKYFDLMHIDLQSVVNRLKLAQSQYLTSDFYFNDKQLTKRPMKTYVSELLKVDESELNVISMTDDSEQLSIYINYENSQKMNIIGDINLRPCSGTYLTNIQTCIKHILQTKFGYKYKNINPNLFLLGINLYVNVTVNEPKFDSQAKTRTISDITYLLNKISSKLTKYFDKNIMQTIQQNIEHKLHKKLISSNGNNKFIKASNKLCDCTNKYGDVLYIVEGDSAAGPLKRTRNIKTEAIFPLKGKVLNVLKATADKIGKNKELTDLREAIGTENNRRYKYIKILADADSDGRHISVLVLLALQKFAPDMIKQKRVSVMIPPLYAALNKKEYIPLFDESLIAQYKNKKYYIERFKGLGQMEADQIKQVLRSGIEYVVEWPDTIEKQNYMNQVILDSDLKRSILNHEQFCFNTILNIVLDKKS